MQNVIDAFASSLLILTHLWFLFCSLDASYCSQTYPYYQPHGAVIHCLIDCEIVPFKDNPSPSLIDVVLSFSRNGIFLVPSPTERDKFERIARFCSLEQCVEH